MVMDETLIDVEVLHETFSPILLPKNTVRT